MTKRELDKPEFWIGLRGYDREQVDDYIDRLRALVSEAEDRARDAERRYDAAAADAIKLVRATEVQERRRAGEAERGHGRLKASSSATRTPRSPRESPKYSNSPSKRPTTFAPEPRSRSMRSARRPAAKSNNPASKPAVSSTR